MVQLVPRPAQRIAQPAGNCSLRFFPKKLHAVRFAFAPDGFTTKADEKIGISIRFSLFSGVKVLQVIHFFIIPFYCNSSPLLNVVTKSQSIHAGTYLLAEFKRHEQVYNRKLSTT